MGVGSALLLVLALLAGGAAGATLLERLVAGNAERGPASAALLGRRVRLAHPDRWVWPAGAVSALLGAALALVVIPLGPEWIARDLGIGAFYFIVVVDFVVLGVALTGWGANTAGGVDAYYRVTAQLVAYVIPLGLAYVGAIMMAESLSIVAIVEAQRALPFAPLQPVGFALYLVTGLMQSYRAPFQEPFSRHIRGGVLGVTGGWQALAWRAALGALLFAVAAMGAVLYLGGWLGPWLPGPVWMLLKTFGLMALMLWLGRRIEPVSTATMLRWSWRWLTPIGLVNVLIVGGLILLGVGPA